MHDDFIVTASGDELNLAAPRPGHLTAYSIAWALSQINRYNGHALRPYSVAEHSLLVHDIAERDLHLDVHGRFAALMHDAHEAFCGDMHSPGKRHIAGWAAWEQHWEHAIRTAYAFGIPAQLHRQAIKHADLIALATERAALLHPAGTTPWACLAGVEPITWVNLLSPERVKADWEFWRDRWLDKYHELEFERNEQLCRGRPEVPSHLRTGQP